MTAGRPLLDGIRVIEVGQVLAGPYAGMLLADLGADVIKVEPPGGDIARAVGWSYFSSLNRSKRSVVIDLRSEGGQAQLHRLVADSHALIVNMKGTTIRQLGLTYEALRAHNERLVCVAVTGYGLDGSGADRPAFDYVVQAETGVAAMTGEPDGPPSLAGYSVIDNSVGAFAALGLVAAVLRGEGGQLDVSLHDTLLAQQNYRAAAVLNDGREPVRSPLGAHPTFAPAQLFATADGHLAVFVTHDAFWRRLALAMGGEALADDVRFATMAARTAHKDQLAAQLGVLWRERTSAEWVALLQPLGVPIGAVATLAEALASPLVTERGLVLAVEGTRTLAGPIRVADVSADHRPAPQLGEHTAEVLGLGGAA